MNHAPYDKTGTTLVVGRLAVFLLCCHHAVAMGQPPKPCDFFTKQAAETVFGAPLDPGRDKVMSCTYSAAGGDDQSGLMVDFIPPSAASPGMSMSEIYDNLIHQDPTSTRVPLTGLGDQADYMTSQDKTQASVQVMYHSAIVGIMVTHSPNPNGEAALIQAVRRMMRKL